MIDMRIIRNNILREMIVQGINQTELIKKAKVSQTTLNGFLTGNKPAISLDTLLKIANGLELPVEVLLGSSKPLESKIRFLSDLMQDFSEKDQNSLFKLIRGIITAFANRG